MKILEKLEYISKYINENKFTYTTKNDKFKKTNFISDIYFSMYLEDVKNKFMSSFSTNIKKSFLPSNILNIDKYDIKNIENKLINELKPLDNILKNISKIEHYKSNDIDIELLQLTENENPKFLVSAVINIEFKPNMKILDDMLDDWNNDSDNPNSDWTYSDITDELEAKALDDVEKTIKNKLKNVKKIEISKNGRNTDKDFNILITMEYEIK